MVVRRNGPTNASNGSPVEQFPVTPLLHLQRRIAACFKEAHESFSDMPEIGTTRHNNVMILYVGINVLLYCVALYCIVLN